MIIISNREMLKAPGDGEDKSPRYNDAIEALIHSLQKRANH